MQLFLSWGYILVAIASAVAALKTGRYSLLLGIPISLAALPIVILTPIARTVLETASNDAAIPAPVRVTARFFAKFSYPLFWQVTFWLLLFNERFVGAWLVGTYIFASKTIRWYQAKYLPPIRFNLSSTHVAPGETAAAIEGS